VKALLTNISTTASHKECRFIKGLVSFFILITILAGLMAACGATQPAAAPAATGSGEKIVIVSSLPRIGPSKAQTDTIANAIKQRLEEDQNQACGGTFSIEYRDWDDATADGQSDPATEASNAKKAAADADVMIYIGTWNSGVAKTSIPILNAIDLVMISPANTYPGLTTSVGAEPGEPDKYYPSGKRNYTRVVPNDNMQGAAGATWAKELGAKAVFILDDTQRYGKNIADMFEAKAKEIGMQIVGREGIDGQAADYRALAAKILDLNPDLVYFGGFPEQNVGQLWKDIRGTGYKGKLMGPDSIKVEGFLKTTGADVAEGTYVTSSGVAFEQLTGKGADWYKNYKAKFNAEPESYAIYGYETANVALAAIKQVCEKNRARIRDAVFATRDFDGALGKWSFDQNGDTTFLGMSGYQVKSGKFEFVQAIK
jgi:branched-chain amino acid transport system substrate-binding protein